MTKATGPFRDSQAPSWLSGPWTNVPVEPLSHRPWVSMKSVFIIHFLPVMSIMQADFIKSHLSLAHLLCRGVGGNLRKLHLGSHHYTSYVRIEVRNVHCKVDETAYLIRQNFLTI